MKDVTFYMAIYGLYHHIGDKPYAINYISLYGVWRIIRKPAKLLDQFKTTACEPHAESRGSAGEESRRFESRSSGVGVFQ